MELIQLWRDHSLTIVLTAIGLGLLALAAWLEEGTWFDIVVGLGHGAVAVAMVNVLATRLRERNKPED